MEAAAAATDPEQQPGQTLPVRQIRLPLPESFGPLAPVNAYLIEAEPLTLVDTGINTPDAQNALVLALAGAGYFVESLERILITHAHPDHYGLIPYLQEASGATVYFPEREIARVRDKQMLFEVGRLLVEAGMPLDLLFKMDQQRKKDPAPRVPHEEVVPVKDGDMFAFTSEDGGFELEALLMPGHTGGHVVYFEPETRTMFAGDQLLPDVSPNPLLEPSLDEPGRRRRSLQEYLASLERMANMDIALAYPGHGDPVTNPQRLVESTIEHHLKRKAAVAQRLDERGKTPYDIAQEVYPHVTGYDTFLAVSEIVAHLDLVVHDGNGIVEEREGITYYLAAP